ncbi:hypothetical protein LCGC14_1398170 [marine sediment metagenome]|uniref:Uncharacterized protein n=1 Tax=marine sediment metagenome TaxID=412755 RepID=A0A0F9JXW8_9ZZZZ
MSNFRNVQNAGVWVAGGTYTFEMYRQNSPYGFAVGALHLSETHDVLFTEACKDWLIANPWEPALAEFPNLDGWSGNLDLNTLLDNGSAGSGGDSQVAPGKIIEDNGWDDWSTVTVEISEGIEDGTFFLFWASVTAAPELDVTEVYEISVGPPAFSPPLPSGVTLDGDGNSTGTPTGENNMIVVKRLVVAANSKIWYEQI